jgi:LAO/AO transport system kinase
VGITGVPGSGKSTLVGKLVQALRERGMRVAVIAIDPSSPYSGGAILGDRVRMGAHTLDPDVFIRSMATRGTTGGLAASALACADILDIAGFDPILIETVGVGQDEVEIARAAHSTIVVSAPGLGDEVQAIKAGILEIADIHVVSKCDRPDAQRTLADLHALLALKAGLHARPAWLVPVIGTSAEQGLGISELADALVKHREHLQVSGHDAERALDRVRYRLMKVAENMLRERLRAACDSATEATVISVVERTLDPYSVATQLLGDGCGNG